MPKILHELTISPAMAESLLARTTQTSKARLQESRVLHFTRRINKQRWNQWSGIILIDQSGGIIDGLHRLEAIARGYVDVPILVSVKDPDYVPLERAEFSRRHLCNIPRSPLG